MSLVHIYTARCQPATSFVDDCGPEPMRMQIAPDKLVFAFCCRHAKPAGDCVVQVFYDATYFYCEAGKGCKDPAFIAAKKAREFQNRSDGQRRRWERAKG